MFCLFSDRGTFIHCVCSLNAPTRLRDSKLFHLLCLQLCSFIHQIWSFKIVGWEQRNWPNASNRSCAEVNRYCCMNVICLTLSYFMNITFSPDKPTTTLPLTVCCDSKLKVILLGHMFARAQCWFTWLEHSVGSHGGSEICHDAPTLVGTSEGTLAQSLDSLVPVTSQSS